MNAPSTAAAKRPAPPDAKASAGQNKAPNTPSPAASGNWQTAWQNMWGQRSAREQNLLSLGALFLSLTALWSLALAPALRTWQEAPAKQAQLDAQSQRMHQLQMQAQGLQKPQTLSRAEAVQWLSKSLDSLGPNAQISMQGESATLRLQAAPAQALARWMVQARENAQALPLQADVQQVNLPNDSTLTAAQNPQDAASTWPANPLGDALWRGTVVLRLPATP